MPLRSVKMYRFIFGFQRRVWWPKWTPLSRSCFIVTTVLMAAVPSFRARGTWLPWLVPPFLALPAMTAAVAVRGSVVPGARWWSDHANAADRDDLAGPGCCQGLPVWSPDRVAR